MDSESCSVTNNAKWICVKCTFINANDRDECEMCQNKKESLLPSSEWNCPSRSTSVATTAKEEKKFDELDPDIWQCPSCTYHNPTEQRICGMCTCSSPNATANNTFREISNQCDIRDCPYLEIVALQLKHYTCMINERKKVSKSSNDLNFLIRILNNIFKDPNNDAFHNINLSRVSIKFENCEMCIGTLYNTGFYLSDDCTRLLYDIKRLNNLKKVLWILQNDLVSFWKQTFPDYTNAKLVDIYLHLLKHHDSDFEFISSKIIAGCNNCALNQCLPMKRVYRNRFKDNDEIRRELDLIHDDLKCQIAQSLLDTIHCYYCHSYHIGHKISKDDMAQLLRTDVDEKDDIKLNDMMPSSVTSVDMNKVQEFMRCKRQSFAHIEALERVNTPSNRFCNKQDNTAQMYDNGVRFFYWDYYKHAEEVNDPVVTHGTAGRLKQSDDVYANEGYTLKDWYIAAKYHDLKSELLNNGICKININQLNFTKAKADLRWDSGYGRRIRRKSTCYDEYDPGDLSVDHIIVMMVYCNFDVFQYSFSATFRRLLNECDNDFKQRHSNYAQMARLLRELVECFGTQDVDNTFESTKIYRGVSTKTEFMTINPCIKGPFSATPSVAVATSFSTNSGKDGLIVEFQIGYKYIIGNRMFKRKGEPSYAFVDCMWLSDFTGEEERFFIGGYSRFYINSIETTTGDSYKLYIAAMREMLLFIDCAYLLGFAHVQFDHITAQLVYRLLSHELSKCFPNDPGKYPPWENIPTYVENLFHNFCQNLKRFCFKTSNGPDDKAKKKVYSLLKSTFASEDGMIKLSMVMTVFPGVEEIRIVEDFMPSEFKMRNVDLLKRNTFWCEVVMVICRSIQNSQRLKKIEVALLVENEKEVADIMKPVVTQHGATISKIGWDVCLAHREGTTMQLPFVVISKNDQKTVVKSWGRKCTNHQYPAGFEGSFYVGY